MNKTASFVAAAGAVVLIAAIGFGTLGGFGGPGFGPPPPSAELSFAKPKATPEPSLPDRTSGADASLAEGPHLMWDDSASARSITITIAAPDWHGTPGDGYVEVGPHGRRWTGGRGRDRLGLG